ncbi:MAG: hypothetical protein GY816_05050 [Cytophagales bacterium]|nr:hypothetical protein [Cytophagales bacterium]
MKTRIISIVALLFAFSFFIKAQEAEQKLETNGFIRNYMGVLTAPPNKFSINQNTLNLEFKLQTEKFGLYANPYYYQYADQEDVFDIRELYIDLVTDKFDFRIGKQQIVWGQADGVFITDIVSPLDLTDFLLRDFNEIRIGVNAVKVNYYPHNDHNFEMIWVQSFTPSISPQEGSIWQPDMDFMAPPTFDYSNQTRGNIFGNGEFFAKYSLSKSWADIQLIGAYTWDDAPSLHMSPITDPTPGLLIQPEHHRLSLAGMSFNTQIADFILRGEGAYYFGKYWQTTDISANDALIKKDYLNYVVGLDKTVRDWKFSSQFIQKRINGYEKGIYNDEIDNLATLLVSRSLFRETVRLEWFSYHGFNDEDALIRFRGFYYPQDAVSIELGTNIFLGTEGAFGQYNTNDMIYSRIKYSF